jgi:hypothetical protein
MAEFAPEVVRLFAGEVRSLRSCNHKLSLLFPFVASAADQQQILRMVVMPGHTCRCARASAVLVTAHQPSASPSSNQSPAELAEGQSMQREQGDFRIDIWYGHVG